MTYDQHRQLVAGTWRDKPPTSLLRLADIWVDCFACGERMPMRDMPQHCLEHSAGL
jgi:hypothetical protein